ncbi:MAG TPA: TonB family protein, partial [Kofleriaceae bacterium]|nr:TonB family protein [Kofleriaceae bacterium]
MTRRMLLVALACACGHAASPAPSFRPPPKLPAPPPSDPAAFGHAYLEQIGARLQGDWGAFLEDLRLRLPPTDPLNDARLVVAIECRVSKTGAVADLRVAPSGQPAFDRAAEEIVSDAAPLAPPPVELLSDDDTVHLRWTFARDRRQAGVAGAAIDRIEWPAARAVPKLLDAGDVGEAARRIAKDPSVDPALAQRVFEAAIIDAIGSSDLSVRREAAAAIDAVHSIDFAGHAIGLANGAVDLDVRVHAVRALDARELLDADPHAFHDPDAAPVLSALLAREAELPAPVVVATARALVSLHREPQVDQAVAQWLTISPTADTIALALAVLAEVPAPSAVPALRKLAPSADPATRAAVCTALAWSLADAGAWSAITRGLRDPDAGVRAACAGAAGRGVAAPPKTAYAKVAALMRDRDERVRAAAMIAAASIDPARAA